MKALDVQTAPTGAFPAPHGDTPSISPSVRALGREGELVAVAGTRLSVSERGQGRPVVCLHAAGHGSRDFDPVNVPARVITIDWPGHGGSDADIAPASARRYAELVEAFLETRELKDVVLLGCSVGGAAATHLAVKRPDLVTGLVLCNSGGFARPSRATSLFCRAMAWVYRHPRFWFEAFFRAKYALLLRGPHARPQRDRIVAAGRRVAPILAELWASFAEPAADIRALPAQVRCPVLLAWARSDPFNSHRLIEGLDRFGVPLRLFPGGHAPFLEAPDEFSELLAAWLADRRRCQSALETAASPFNRNVGAHVGYEPRADGGPWALSGRWRSSPPHGPPHTRRWRSPRWPRRR